ncbi:hypothetical protein C8R43DRAFT_1126472 [Mycena crocata]|nr:hypothetical protein C8R43DRAFT_1126472 [Mycena crocata]
MHLAFPDASLASKFLVSRAQMRLPLSPTHLYLIRHPQPAALLDAGSLLQCHLRARSHLRPSPCNDDTRRVFHEEGIRTRTQLLEFAPLFCRMIDGAACPHRRDSPLTIKLADTPAPRVLAWTRSERTSTQVSAPSRRPTPTVSAQRATQALSPWLHHRPLRCVTFPVLVVRVPLNHIRMPRAVLPARSFGAYGYIRAIAPALNKPRHTRAIHTLLSPHTHLPPPRVLRHIEHPLAHLRAASACMPRIQPRWRIRRALYVRGEPEKSRIAGTEDARRRAAGIKSRCRTPLAPNRAGSRASAAVLAAKCTPIQSTPTPTRFCR